MIGGKTAVVIPTIRPEQFNGVFEHAWLDQFEQYNVELVVIWDGEKPCLEHMGKHYSVKDIMGEDADLIDNYTSACRNLGFAYVAKFLPGVESVYTVDDDCLPIGDTIGDHLKALEMRVPISWMAVGTEYTRGFPYGIREEAEVVLSHGIWSGIYDLDAPTQLVKGNPSMDFYKMPISKGIYAPLSGMNLMFKRKALPYMYWAPKAEGLMRFDDIWAGICAKREFDKKNWAVVTGYAKVEHSKLSNVFKNLRNEAVGIGLNETFWEGDEAHPYFKTYREKRDRWRKMMDRLLKNEK